jgi:hypothetical protein
MKKVLLLTAVSLLLLFSCKKENARKVANASSTKYKVTFNVVNFKIGKSTFALRPKGSTMASSDTLTALNTYFDELDYIVYDDLRNTVKRVIQDSTMANMGTITDSLPAGTYRISIVAGKKGLAIRDNFFTENDFGYGGNSWQDTFFDSFMITVNYAPVNQNVTLSRVVSKLELQVLDTMPMNADSLVLTVYQDAYGHDLFENVPMTGYITSRFSVPVPASAKGKPNFTMDRLVGNFDCPVTITCKKTDNTVIASKSVQDVYFTPNERTILSGDLFTTLAGHNGSQTFTTKIDTAWDSDPVNGGHFSVSKQKLTFK